MGARILEAPYFFFYDPGSDDPLDVFWFGFGQWDGSIGALLQHITNAGYNLQANGIYDALGNLLVNGAIYDAIAETAINAPSPA